MKRLRKIIGNRIASERKRQKLSQEELAELADVHRTYVGTVERGELNCSIERIHKLSKALNLPLSELFKNY